MQKVLYINIFINRGSSQSISLMDQNLAKAPGKLGKKGLEWQVVLIAAGGIGFIFRRWRIKRGRLSNG